MDPCRVIYPRPCQFFPRLGQTPTYSTLHTTGVGERVERALRMARDASMPQHIREDSVSVTKLLARLPGGERSDTTYRGTPPCVQGAGCREQEDYFVG